MYRPDPDAVLIIDIADCAPYPIDGLPYTQAFEHAYEQYLTECNEHLERHEFFRRLLRARKTSRLQRAGDRRRSPSVRRFSEVEIAIAASLARSAPLSIDDLPYTDEFEQVHEAFTDLTGSCPSRHET